MRQIADVCDEQRILRNRRGRLPGITSLAMSACAMDLRDRAVSQADACM